MTAPGPFAYDGPPELREAVTTALSRVIDPEVALSIVDMGLVYGVTVTPQRIHVSITMTSAACPVADVVIDEIHAELGRAVPDGRAIEVELVWEPAWTPGRLSDRARRFLQW